MDRLSPRERLALHAGIAGVFLAVVFGVAALRPEAIPWLAEHAALIGYSALFFFVLSAIGMGRAAFDGLKETASAQQAWRFARSPERWWPPTRRRIAREKEERRQRERSLLRLGGAASVVAKRFRELMEGLDPIEREQQEIAKSPEELWSRLGASLTAYSAGIAQAPEEERPEHQYAIGKFRELLAERGRPEQYFEVVKIIEDWLRELRKGRGVHWAFQLMTAEHDATPPEAPPSTTAPESHPPPSPESSE